jgi:hypothetical protein
MGMGMGMGRDLFNVAPEIKDAQFINDYAR